MANEELSGRKLKIVPWNANEPEAPVLDPDQAYPLAKTMFDVLTSQQLQLGMLDCLRNEGLAARIGKAVLKGEPFIIFDQADWEIIRSVFEKVKGFGAAHVELLKRIRDVECVPLAEKK